MKCTAGQFEQFKEGPIWADMREMMGKLSADIVASQMAIPEEDDDLDKVTIDNLLNKGRLDGMEKVANLPELCIEEIELERKEKQDERQTER